MVKTLNTKKYFGFQYDFTVDGGAVGNFFTGLNLGGSSASPGLVWCMILQIVVPLVSAGGNLSFGTIATPTLYGTHPNALWGAGSRAVVFAATATDAEVVMALDTAPITAGKFKITWEMTTLIGA